MLYSWSVLSYLAILSVSAVLIVISLIQRHWREACTRSLFAVFLFGLIVYLPNPEGLTDNGKKALAIFVLCVIY